MVMRGWRLYVARRLAWLLCGVSLVLVTSTLLIILAGWRSTPSPAEWSWQVQAVFVIGISGAPILGALIASNIPHSSYGWVWLGFGMGFILASFGQSYGTYAVLAHPGSLPAPRTVAAILEVGWVAAITLAPFILLLFPDGRLPSPGWRLVAWPVAAAGAFGMIFWFLRLEKSFALSDNPLGVGGHGGEALVAITDVGVYFFLVAIVLSAFSLIPRYLDAEMVQRKQIQLFIYAAVLLSVLVQIRLVFGGALGYTLSRLLDVVALVGLYVALAVGIVYYQLWDIQIIIRRSLVIGPLLTVLTVVFVLATQLLLPFIFQFIPALEDSPSIKTVVSVLIVVALFKPLHARLEAGVSRLVDRLMGALPDVPRSADASKERPQQDDGGLVRRARRSLPVLMDVVVIMLVLIMVGFVVFRLVAAGIP
jgi:hypothetical protein